MSRAGCLFSVPNSAQLAALLAFFLAPYGFADRTSGSNATVTNITQTSASFSSSITTNSSGTGSLALNFFVGEVGASSGFYTNNASPSSIPTNGNATTTFTGSSAALSCGKEYEVTGTYSPSSGQIFANGYTKFTTAACPASNTTLTTRPSALSFDNRTNGTTSEPQTITVSNTGNEVLTVSQVTLTGADSDQFSQTNNCSSVPVGGSCAIRVTFVPTTRSSEVFTSGNRVATLSIRHNASGSPTTVGLSGERASSLIGVPEISVSTLSFGERQINTTSSSQTITIRNSGTAALQIFTFSFSEPAIRLSGTDASQFSRSTDCDSIPVAGSCSVSVRFAPTTVGSKLATIQIEYRSGSNTKVKSITLNGVGALFSPVIAVSPSSVDFGNQAANSTSAAQTVTVSNRGTGPLTIGTVALAGVDASQFVQTNNCSSVAVGSTCAISVTFKPTSLGAKSATISITHNATGSPTSIALSGTALAAIAPVISVSPAALSFGNQIIDTTSSSQGVTVSSGGNATLTISSVSFIGADASQFSQTNNCGSVATGSTCSISVVFKPTGVGAKSASISIAHNASNSPSVVGVSGVGTPVPAAAIAASPTLLVFVDQSVNVASATQRITVSNPGTGPLSITGIAFSGINASDFERTHNCESVAAGSSCVINVSFKSVAVGSKSATLVITHNASSAAIELKMLGIAKGSQPTTLQSDRDALAYIASHPDLIEAFGADAAKGRSHYEQLGLKEGRKITFDPLYYTASHPDLIEAFGADEIRAATDYIQRGFKANRRVTFSPLHALRYLASHSDLIEALAVDATVAVKHYVQWGYKEGRKITFEPLRYVASHPDLIVAVGSDETKATLHYLQLGYREKRQTTFTDLQALRYTASHPDLIPVFGTSSSQALRHYVDWGFSEGRRITFEPLYYVASHPDLIGAFGIDELKAVNHYIQSGFKEGRAVTYSAIDALSYIASHVDLMAAFGADARKGLIHYIQSGYTEKRQITFVASIYLLLHPDVRSATNNSLLGGVTHYIVYGAKEGRAIFGAPAVEISATTVSFVDRLVNTTSPSQRVTLKNTGLGPLNVSSVSISGSAAAHFRQVSDCSTVLIGSSCNIDVSFSPTTGGAKSASLVLAHNGTPSATSIALSGTTVSSVSVAGSVRLSGVFQVDSDTNDSRASQVRNNSLSQAQALVAPFTLVGHVNQVQRGDSDGRWFSLGDTDDVYKVTLRRGQPITLSVATDKQTDADLLLEVYDSTNRLVAGPLPYSRQQTLRAPADGDYFIAVRAKTGSSRYALEVSAFAESTADATGALSNEVDFVPGELLVSFKERRAASKGASRKSIRSIGAGGRAIVSVGYTVQDDLGDGLGRVRLSLDGDLAAYADIGANPVDAQASPLPETLSSPLILGDFIDDAQRNRYLTLIAARDLAVDPTVEGVSVNYRVSTSATPNDPLYGSQKWHYEQIASPAAWDITTGSADVVVAVLDSGVSPHPDLVDNLLPGFDFVSSDPKGDGDGEDTDPSDPGTNQEPNPVKSSHGTHVAGTVAARGNNSVGGTGVSWSTKILPVRVLGVGGGSFADVLKGMKYAAGILPERRPVKVANVINMSLGDSSRSRIPCDSLTNSLTISVINQVRAAGTIVVVANGNDKDQGKTWVSYPANCPGAVSVAATNPNRQITYYSQEGGETDVAAPGGASDGIGSNSVWSTNISRVGEGATTYVYNGLSGTSMATPHVAGVVALMKSVRPAMTPADFDDFLASGQITTDIGASGKDNASGYGLINALNAATAAQSSTPNIPPRIDVTPSLINFGTATNQSSVYVTLVGNSNESVSVAASSAQAWLTATFAEKVDSRTLRYVVSVDRSVVANGSFEGGVSFRASTPSATLNTVNVTVVMGKSATQVIGNAGSQYALLLDRSTEKVTNQSAVFQALETGSSFSISGVIAGDYYLVSGTDIDSNNFICEEAEICSLYRVSLTDAGVVSVAAPVSGLKLTAQILSVFFAQNLSATAASASESSGKRKGIPVFGVTGSSVDIYEALGLARPNIGAASFSAVGPSTPSNPSLATKGAGDEEGPRSMSVNDEIENKKVSVAAERGFWETSKTQRTQRLPSGNVDKSLADFSNDSSSSEDVLTGSQYSIVRKTSVRDLRQEWRLEYRARGGVTLNTKPLPTTANVFWRLLPGSGIEMSSTAWTRVCSDRIWAVQDGYQLLFNVTDRTFIDVRSGPILVNSAAEATLITDVSCADSGGVRLEGYAFGVSDNEPPLRTSRVPATRFGLALDRYGTVTKRELNPAPFDIIGLCSAPANEQQMFCSEAKKAVGW
jgi:serine protease